MELVPSADVGGMLKGVGNLTKDALTFKWAQVLLNIGPCSLTVHGQTSTKLPCSQASMKDVAVNTVVVTEIACWFFIGECIGEDLICERCI